MTLTRQQRESLYGVYERHTRPLTSADPYSTAYRNFRRSVEPGWTGEIMVYIAGMWIGIEKNGYTHT